MKMSWADYVGDSDDDDSAQGDDAKGRLVWHYTTSDVFRSIVENHVIWASDINHLNDTDEIRLGIKRFRKTLKVREAQPFSPKEQTEPPDLSEVRSLVEDWEDYPLSGSAFTVSFSRFGDDNSQWERYGGNATGVALGIRLGAYMPILGEGPSAGSLRTVIEDVPFYWTKMLYKRRKQVQAIQAAMSSMVDGMSRNPSPDDDIDMTDLIRDQALGDYAMAAARVKNRGFRAEREYRYVVSRPDSQSAIHARPGGVPFVKVTGGPDEVDSDPRYRPMYQATPMQLPIAKVRLGPKSKESAGDVQDLLHQNGYRQVQVKKSRSTLR